MNERKVKNRFEEWVENNPDYTINVGGWYGGKAPTGDGSGDGGGDGASDSGTGGDGDSLYTEEELRIFQGEIPPVGGDDGSAEDGADGGDGSDGADGGSGDGSAVGDGDGGGDSYAKAEGDDVKIKPSEEGTTRETYRGNGGKPGGSGGAPKTPYQDAASRVVEFDDTTHPYHGRTLGQIYDLDPDMAYSISPRLAIDIQLGKAKELDAAVARENEYQQQVQKETDDFVSGFVKSEFPNAGGYNALDPTQQKTVNDMVDKVQGWMLDNNKFGITVDEAYILMSHKQLVSSAASKGVEKVLDDAMRGKVRTVQAKPDPDGGNNTPDDMSKWSDDQVFDHLESLDDAGFEKFRKSATPAMKKKFPDIPW